MIRLSMLRVFVVTGGLAFLLLAVLGYRSLNASQAQGLKVFGDAPTFALTDHLERPVRSDEFRAKVVVANFVYTNCKDICPLLSFHMQTLQDRLHQENLLGTQVQLLSFTVDPARDTPPVLRTYAERWQADPSSWRFLTGPTDEVVPLIVKGFRLGVEALPPQEADPSGQSHDEHAQTPRYEVMHSGRFVLIDRQGRIRAYYDGREFDLEHIMRDIRALLH